MNFNHDLTSEVNLKFTLVPTVFGFSIGQTYLIHSFTLIINSAVLGIYNSSLCLLLLVTLVFCNHVHLVADRMAIGIINPQTHKKS